ncbi:MAG: arginine repressor [Actinobacteria bacterium]|nr:arginine repressor [Actinomycetota bacterium]
MKHADLPKARRRARISDLVASHVVTSQTELRRMLAEEGLDVTQPTLSRDLLELRAVRVRRADGTVAYAITDDSAFDLPEGSSRLARLCSDLLLRAEASGNIVVVRTPAGAAQYFASALDRAGWDDVLGCVAGDDTVMLITRDVTGGEAVAERLLTLGSEGVS